MPYKSRPQQFHLVWLYRSRPSQGRVTGRKVEYKVFEGLIEVLITLFELRENGVKNWSSNLLLHLIWEECNRWSCPQANFVLRLWLSQTYLSCSLYHVWNEISVPRSIHQRHNLRFRFKYCHSNVHCYTSSNENMSEERIPGKRSQSMQKQN